MQLYDIILLISGSTSLFLIYCLFKQLRNLSKGTKRHQIAYFTQFSSQGVSFTCQTKKCAYNGKLSNENLSLFYTDWGVVVICRKCKRQVAAGIIEEVLKK